MKADADPLTGLHRLRRQEGRLRPLPIRHRVAARENRERIDETELLGALTQPLHPPLDRAGESVLEFATPIHGGVALARELGNLRERVEDALRPLETRGVTDGTALECFLQSDLTLRDPLAPLAQPVPEAEQSLRTDRPGEVGAAEREARIYSPLDPVPPAVGAPAELRLLFGDELRCRGRGCCPKVRDEVGNRDVGLVSDGRDRRNPGGRECASDPLVVEWREVLG